MIRTVLISVSAGAIEAAMAAAFFHAVGFSVQEVRKTPIPRNMQATRRQVLRLMGS